jgi:predicted PurR-regulated permease PerM
MSNDKTRREIEELRAQMDTISTKSKTAKPAEQPTEKLPDDGDRHTPIVGAELNGQSDETTDREIPAGGSRRSATTFSRDANGSFFPFSAGKIMPGAVIMAITLTLLIVGRDFLVPLAVAVLLSNLLNALAAAIGQIQLGRFRMPGWLAWVLALAALLLVAALFYWILTSQSEALIAAAPVYEANFAKMTERFSTLIGIEAMPSTAKLMESLNLGALLSWLGGSVGSLFAEVVLVVLYLAFLLAEQRHFPEKITRILPDAETAAKARILMSQMSKQVQKYVWIKTVVSLFTGFASYAVLRLVGVDFAAVWGLVIFLLNYIPSVGSAMGVAFPALLALLQFETLTPFVVVVLGLGTTQFVIGNVVEPAMMGSSLNLSSFVIILSLTFWGMIWGIAGMVLCVPIVVIIAIVCSNFKRLHWIAVLLSSDGRIMRTSQNS